MDEKVKKLIAVGASVSANCQPCLQFHAGKAVETGANEQEIKDAIEIGKMVRQGAASNVDKFASSLSQSASLSPDSRNAGCACCP
jgi:AhpD family alkylhydroperoxidase